MGFYVGFSTGQICQVFCPTQRVSFDIAIFFNGNLENYQSLILYVTLLVKGSL